MESVTSKRHFLNFYGIFLFCISFISIGIIMILNDHPKDKAMLTFGGLLLIVASIYFSINLIKKCPKIIIDSKSIQFNSEIFKIEEIKKITLTGMYQFFLLSEINGVKIIFKDRSVKYIFDPMYSNTSQIKLTLDYLINNNKHTVVKKVRPNIASEHFNKYKGYFIYSFRGILLLSITGSVFVGYIKKPITNQLDLTPFFLLFLSILFQWQFNYFEVSNNHFRIRNHLNLWKKDTYKIEDIKEVTFQSQVRAPNIIKIIFKDHTTKKYFAATLSNRKWKELQQALKNSNIKVINKLQP